MKIIFNTYPSAFQCPGGGEIQLIKSKQALEGLGHEVTLFNQWDTKLEDCDLIHHFSVQGGSSNFCNYVYYKTAKPLVISPILWLGEDTSEYPMGEIQHLFNMADGICPNSDAETKRICEKFNVAPSKFTTTHNGIDSIFREMVDEQPFREHYNIHHPFILCVANIEPRKNQHRLINAARKAGIPLVLIGHVRSQDYYNNLNITECSNTNYIGAIDHHSPLLRSAYAACELFALPSLLETPGLAALEAAASGTKLLITREGSTGEYFGADATYCDPLSTRDIMEGINNTLMTPATRHKTPEFSWANCGRELENAYLKSIESKTKK